MQMYFLLAWKNIWRNRKRTWITASSIGFAVFFACLLQSMQLGSYERMIDNSVRFFTGHLAIHQKDYWDDKILDNSFNDQNVPNSEFSNELIEVSIPRINSFAFASSGQKTKGVIVNGIDPEKEAKMNSLDQKVISGTYISKGFAIIAEGLADQLKIGVEDTLILISQGYHGVNAAAKFPISGIVKFPVPELNKSAVYLELTDAQEFYGAYNLLTSYNILLENSSYTQTIKSEVENLLSGTDLEVMSWREMMPEIIQGIEMDYYGGLIMIYILYLIIGFGIFGTFLMMTKERSYEFAILTSIGMKKAKIQLMVTLEILMLSFFGVFLGLLTSFPFLLYFSFNPIEITGDSAKAFEDFGYEAIVPFSMEPEVFYHQGIVVLIIALFLGIYPLLIIKNLKITKAIKE